MSTRITLAVAATFALGTAASASTIDFNDNLGEVITSVTSRDGAIMADISAIGGIARAVVFDTSIDMTADPDLEAPFENQEDSSITANPGGILIVQENAGDPIVPDDAVGGSITFTFTNTRVNFSSFSFFDGGVVTVSSTDTDNVVSFEVDEPDADGPNLFDTFDVTGFDNVSNLTFDFAGSGGIDDLQVAAVPLPAGILLLGGGLAAFGGFGSWRKRKQA